MTTHGVIDPTALRARTVKLATDVTSDIFALAADDGCLFESPTLGVAGHGVAATFELGAGLADANALACVVEWLAAVERDGDDGGPGTGPLAMGAFGFEPDAPATLVVPRRVVTRDEHGVEWVTVIAGRDETLADHGPIPSRIDTEPPTQDEASWRERLVSLRATPAPEVFADAVAAAVSKIEEGRLEKVVLARRLDLLLRSAVVPSVLLRRLHRREPACTAFSFPVEDGRFVGASPELLVSRRSGFARCHPLAGTVALGGNDVADRAAIERLRSSTKDQVEHNLVVRAIVAGLRSCGGTVVDPGPPETVALRSVAHLATEVLATFPDRPSAPGVLELLAELHPTPAVGGVPRDVALEVIRGLEAAPRGSWAGPVGWVDHLGNGDWVIGIRSATVRGAWATLWAGAGVVAGSVPASELAETTVKLVPVADAMLPGVEVALLGQSSAGEGFAAG